LKNCFQFCKIILDARSYSKLALRKIRIYAVSIYFHSVIHSFNNSLLYDCVFGNQIDDRESIHVSSLLWRALGIEVSQIISIGSKLIDLYDSASSADLPNFCIIIICITFHWGGKKPHLRTALYSWVMNFIPISDSFCRMIGWL